MHDYFLSNWDLVYGFLIVFLSTYVFTLVTDIGKTTLEVFFNFIRAPGNPPRKILTHDECAIVIPCHNSGDCILHTLNTLPAAYTVICVANACKDDTVEVLKTNQHKFPNLVIMETGTPGKIRAVVLGVIKARSYGHSHFLLLDDDIEWTQENGEAANITVYDKDKCVTALPVVPSRQDLNWLRAAQAIEYQMMCASKRAQGNLGNVIMASGAAGIYKIESFMNVILEHDGEHVGDDLQCSYLHHVKGMRIDFNSEAVVATHPPKTVKAWWQQRTRRWEASPLLNSAWAFKIVFAPLTKGRNPGWWIRGVAAYRMFVVLNDLVRCFSFPVVLIFSPWVLPGVWLITYCSVLLKMLTFAYFFKNESYVKADKATVLSVLTYPFYGLMMWVSRVWAIPKGTRLVTKYHVLGARKVSRFSSSLVSLEDEVNSQGRVEK